MTNKLNRKSRKLNQYKLWIQTGQEEMLSYESENMLAIYDNTLTVWDGIKLRSLRFRDTNYMEIGVNGFNLRKGKYARKR